MSESKVSVTARVRYTVSWEEFLEMFEYLRPNPDLVAVTATLGCAGIFAVFCVLLARAVDREDRGTVGFFWALPVLLVGFAAWELTFHTANKRKEQLKKLRSTYQQSFSQQQAFACDRDRWVHETEDSKQEINWSALQTMSEWPSTVTLSTKSYVAVVPRRVLTASDMSVIRQAAFGNAGFKFCVGNSFLDWAYTTLTELWKGNLLLMLAIHSGAIMALIWMIRRLGSPSNPTDFFWGEFLCVVVLLLGFTAQFWYLPLKYWTINDDVKSPTEIQVYDKGLWFKRPNVEFFRAWSSFQKLKENRRSFLLTYSAEGSFVLGKSGVTADQIREFRQLVRTHIVKT
jgi:hypothetical protein